MELTHVRRYDALLLAGLGVALFVIFSRPIKFALDAARAFEDEHGLLLIPALVILTVVFGIQQQAKRHAAAERASAAAAEAVQARERARDLEALVDFGRSLAEALDLDALREATWRHLPAIVRTRQTWLLVREDDQWKGLTGVRAGVGSHGVSGALAAAATEIAGHAAPESRVRGADAGDLAGFPLVFDGSVIGLLAVQQAPEPLAEAQRRILAAAAPLLAIAIKNAQLFAGLRDSTVHDSLTGSFTRGHALELLDTELKRAERSGLPLSVVMLDLDYFKRINDQFGHLAGDTVLTAVGRQLESVLRATDIRCRFGGEEFLIVLPDTPQAGALRVAESLRQVLTDLRVAWQGTEIPVTASFGVASARRGERDRQALLARADAALYRAKQAGRNCVREHQATRLAAFPTRVEGGSVAAAR